LYCKSLHHGTLAAAAVRPQGGQWCHAAAAAAAAAALQVVVLGGLQAVPLLGLLVALLMLLAPLQHCCPHALAQRLVVPGQVLVVPG
jgi:hypothetical protein